MDAPISKSVYISWRFVALLNSVGQPVGEPLGLSSGGRSPGRPAPCAPYGAGLTRRSPDTQWMGVALENDDQPILDVGDARRPPGGVHCLLHGVPGSDRSVEVDRVADAGDLNERVVDDGVAPEGLVDAVRDVTRNRALGERDVVRHTHNAVDPTHRVMSRLSLVVTANLAAKGDPSVHGGHTNCSLGDESVPIQSINAVG